MFLLKFRLAKPNRLQMLGKNSCKLSNNFFIVAYTCFVFFTLHTNQQFLFFNKSLQEMRNDCHRSVAFGKQKKRAKGFHFFLLQNQYPPSPPCSRVNANSHKSRAPQGVFILGHRKKWLELGRTRAFTAIFGEDFRKSGRIEKEDKKPSVLQ